MQFEIDPVTALVTLIATIITTYYIAKAQSSQKELNEQKEKFDRSFYYFKRNNYFEIRLYDHEECLELFGVDIEEMKKDQVSHSQVSFLIQGISLAQTICEEENKLLQDYLLSSRYWMNILTQEKTKKVWVYAEPLVTGRPRVIINAIINGEDMPENLEDLPLDAFT